MNKKVFLMRNDKREIIDNKEITDKARQNDFP